MGEDIDVLRRVDVFTTIHMGSSRYFIPNELSHYVKTEDTKDNLVDVSQLERGVTLERTVSLG